MTTKFTNVLVRRAGKPGAASCGNYANLSIEDAFKEYAINVAGKGSARRLPDQGVELEACLLKEGESWVEIWDKFSDGRQVWRVVVRPEFRVVCEGLRGEEDDNDVDDAQDR